MDKPLNIFDFSDYREFLRAWIEAAKAARTGNLTRLAEVAQVHPTFLSHVLAGSKDLSLEQAALVSDHLRFTKVEQEYFFVLIQLDRAGNAKLKEYLLNRKREIEIEKNKLSQRFEAHRTLTSEQRAMFYSSWIYTALWTATGIGRGQTLDQLATRFQLSRERTQEVLAFLTQVGLCHEEKGVFVMGDSHVHVPNESPFVLKHHANWRLRALQRMENRELNELFFSAPMSISKEDFEKLREKLNQLVKDVVVVAKDSASEDVYCLNIDFFRT